MCLLHGWQLPNIPALLGLRSEYFHKKQSVLDCIEPVLIPDVCCMTAPGMGVGRQKESCQQSALVSRLSVMACVSVVSKGFMALPPLNPQS